MSDLRGPITIEEAFAAGHAAGVKEVVRWLRKASVDDPAALIAIAERGNSATRFLAERAAKILGDNLSLHADSIERGEHLTGQHHNETEGET